MKRTQGERRRSKKEELRPKVEVDALWLASSFPSFKVKQEIRLEVLSIKQKHRYSIYIYIHVFFIFLFFSSFSFLLFFFFALTRCHFSLLIQLVCKSRFGFSAYNVVVRARFTICTTYCPSNCLPGHL